MKKFDLTETSVRQVAVLLIIFNRPDTTEKVFEAIRKAKPARLYVAADAPREDKPADAIKCAAARKIIERVDWDCEVHTLFQEKNIGCSLGPRAAFDWFFAHEQEGIILEDDCVPDITFFQFCSEMLEKYRHNERIISINGSNLGYELKDGNSYTFSRFMNMWGWATWRRSAQEIDYSLTSWRKQKSPLLYVYKQLRQKITDFDIDWYKYWKEKFDLTIYSEKVTWWDWQWIYHQMRTRKFSIVPGKNLVSNIGFNNDATHTFYGDNPAAGLEVSAMQYPLQHPNSLKPDMQYEEEFVKWVWCYYKRPSNWFYLKFYLGKFLGMHKEEDKSKKEV